MTTDTALFIWALVAAFAGAELFVRGASSLGARLGVPPVVIGLTIVAWGTSSPELAVSLGAAARSEGAVAIGNVVGSNIFNVGIILGLSALIHPLRVTFSLVRFDAPILLAVTVLFGTLSLLGPLSRGDGVVLLVAFLAYSFVTMVGARRPVPEAVQEEYRREVPRLAPKLWPAVGGVACGLALLRYGGDLLVDQAIVLARETGISERVIGLTIVAAGTSSPELLTSLVAAAHRSADIAIGNIIGSNIFNLAAIVGASSIIGPIAPGSLVPLDVVALLASSAVLLPVMRSGFVIQRWEGALLIAGYTAYTVALFA